MLFTKNPMSVCVHRYLTTCQTNPQPPGLADFLRGTIALYNLSQEHGYTLKINRDHPIFRYLKDPFQETHADSFSKTLEFLPPMSYEEIHRQLNLLFSSKKSFQIMTNSFYTNKGRFNWGDITEDCRRYMKKLLTPSPLLIDHVHHAFSPFLDLEKPFKAIHIRTNDYNIHHTQFDESTLDHFLSPIRIQLESDSSTYVVFTDCSVLGNKLKDLNLQNLVYVDTKKVHLGDLIHQEERSILDTLGDFFMLSLAKEIYYIEESGFSKVISIVYQIQYTKL